MSGHAAVAFAVATVVATVYITRIAKRALTAELDKRRSIAGAAQ